MAHGFRQQIDPELHPGVRSIIERCWDGTPQNRPRMSQLVRELQQLQEEIGECAGWAWVCERGCVLGEGLGSGLGACRVCWVVVRSICCTVDGMVGE